MGLLVLVLAIISALVLIFAPQVVLIFAPGFAQLPQKFDITVQLLRLTFPYLLLISLTAFFGSILQSYDKFALPALAPVLLNVLMIAGALCLAPHLSTPIMALGVAVLVAGLAQMLVLTPSLYKANLLPMPRLDVQDDGVKKIIALMLPAIFGVSVTQVNLMLGTVYASLMTSGSVTWLYNAERLSELPLGLIGVAIGTVILPTLSRARGDLDEVRFTHTLDWAARLMWLFGLPASVAVALLAEPLIATLFLRGKFTLNDAHMSALALQGMAGGILGFMLIKIFAPAFFARQDSKTPVRIGMIAVFANMVFSLALVGVFWALGLALHPALALATSLSSLLNAYLLYAKLKSHGIYRYDSAWRARFWRYGIASAVMGVALCLALPYFPKSGDQMARVIYLLGLCAIGAMTYAGTLLITGFKPRELRHD